MLYDHIDYVYDLINIKETIDVYCNSRLGFMDGITYQGKRYQFFNGTALTNDNSLVRCIGTVPVEPRVYHWTGYLRPDTISNLIQSKPYLDRIREKVLKAKSILEEHNPSLISNGKAQRFQKVYEDLKSSKHEAIEEYFQMARDKHEKEHVTN